MDYSHICYIDEGISTVTTRIGYRAGDVIEQCRTITLDANSPLGLTIPQIHGIKTTVGKSCKRVFGFGYSALYSGSKEPNITLQTEGDFIKVRATRDINPHSKLQHSNDNGNTPLPSEMNGLYLDYRKIEVRTSSFGYGIFSIKNIRKGDLIESSPFLPVNPSEIASTAILRDYIFSTHSGHGLALGFGSLFNHRDVPNAYWEYDSGTCTVNFYAEEYIQSGQEIFVSYGPDWFSSRNLKPL